MYHRIIEQCASAVERMEAWMDKAERHAEMKHINVEVLMNWQLAPDMAPFTFQIQSACEYLKGGVAGLVGLQPPSDRNVETDIAETRALIRKTVTFVRSITKEQLADVGDRMIRLAWLDEPIDAGRFLVEVISPNVYFHVGNAYAILRQGGVDVGKRDYIGPLYPVPK